MLLHADDGHNLWTLTLLRARVKRRQRLDSLFRANVHDHLAEELGNADCDEHAYLSNVFSSIPNLLGHFHLPILADHPVVRCFFKIPLQDLPERYVAFTG